MALARLLPALLLALLAAAPLRAQDRATLVADRVFINADRTLTAEGAVEVFYRGSRLRAARIVYDRDGDRLTIEGPIVLTEAEGARAVLLADAAALSSDLREGVLTSARMVLEEQLQLAAVEITRTSGRYTRLSKVVASACQVCPENPTPLWEIRARRVTHDEAERQIHFEGAQFRVIGLPVAYIPRLRMPDPTVERATGFLPPRLRTTSGLGTGLKLPYFIAIGPDRDLTVTPYYALSETRTLELRYRQAFAAGYVEFNGALSRDDIRTGETRGYLFGWGAFTLPRDFTLTFGLEAVSDEAYLLDYGISDKDRLQSALGLTRTRANEHISARLINFHSIRAGEDNSTSPNLLADATFHRRFSGGWLGGEAGLRIQAHGHRRSSTSEVDADGDGHVDGRDVARLSARLDWRRNHVLENGMVLSGMGQLAADFYAIGQDPSHPGTVARVVPQAGIELRWPWMKTTRSGAAHVIEPVVQLVWSPEDGEEVPNEDSGLVEFDEGNLFALSRFPGADRHERGLRANLGLGWTRYDPEGWSLGLTVGRVIRAEDLGQFGEGTGLAGEMSDWLVATRLDTAGGLSLTNRALFDDDFGFSRDELRLAWSGERLALATSYVWMDAAPAENRPDDTSELTLDAGWRIGEGWAAALEGRYDFVADRAARAGIGLTYRNECVTVDLSLSRRFTSSTSVRPTTDFDLSVVLGGFGGGGENRPARRSCLR